MNNLLCVICKTQFTAKRSDTKYCSEKCRTKQETIKRTEKIRSQRLPIIKSCLVCNSEFKAKVKTPYQLYCSPICLSKGMNERAVKSGRKKEYYHKNKEKYAELKSKTDIAYKDKMRFSSNKENVLKRDGYKCTECGKEKGLIIHHKDHSGSNENPNNDIDNLITLCRSCHMRIHSGENNGQFIQISKEQILRARSESSSWEEVARKIGVNRATIIKRRKYFNIF